MVTISDVATGLPVSVLEGPHSVVVSVQFDPSSHRVVGASWDGTARVWDATPAYRRWSSPPIAEACGTDVSPEEDQRFIAIGCEDHGSRIWDTARDQLVAELPSVAPTSGELRRAFPVVSAAGDRAAISTGTAVEIYTLPERRLLRTITHPAEISEVAFARRGHDLVSASVDGTLLITRDDGDAFALPQVPGGIDVVGFTPDGRVIAATSRGRLQVLDPGRHLILADLGLPAGTRVRSFRMSADGHRLITIAETGTPMPPVLWDLERYRIIAPLIGPKGLVFSARFVAGDRKILTAGGDGIARLWDGVTGQLQQSYFGSSSYLLDAALGPDGSTVVTAGGDGVLRFWDVATKRMLWTLRAHTSAISGVHFEGTEIVTRSFLGELSRWRISPQDLAGASERYMRCLPLRFDDDTGGLVEQEAACDIPAAGGQ